MSHVKESLGVSDDAALQKFVGAKGWAVEGSVVKISLNDDNTATPKKVDVSGKWQRLRHSGARTRTTCSATCRGASKAPVPPAGS